jgi:electron transport complex protein RnfB
MTLADRIDALLPQTQCTRCGYPACRPYAEALADGSAELNLCQPGGAALVPQLADTLGRPPLAPAHPEAALRIAWIREADCIGCARCLPACPVDAILGARRLGHTVITGDCTGCELCLPACPVDCIELRSPPAHWQPPGADTNRARHVAHQLRVQRRTAVRDRTPTALPAAERRAAMIAAARAASAARRSRT